MSPPSSSGSVKVIFRSRAAACAAASGPPSIRAFTSSASLIRQPPPFRPAVKSAIRSRTRKLPASNRADQLDQRLALQPRLELGERRQRQPHHPRLAVDDELDLAAPRIGHQIASKLTAPAEASASS